MGVEGRSIEKDYPIKEVEPFKVGDVVTISGGGEEHGEFVCSEITGMETESKGKA